jgi:hypothetical protein
MGPRSQDRDGGHCRIDRVWNSSIETRTSMQYQSRRYLPIRTAVPSTCPSSADSRAVRRVVEGRERDSTSIA